MEWLDFSLNRAGYKQLSELPKPDMHTQMLLCGLLIMADWIASNTYYFPLIDADDTGEHLDLSERVYAAWKNLNLPSGWLPGAFIMDNDEFKSRFGFLPNTVQSAFIQAIHNSVEPRIYIRSADGRWKDRSRAVRCRAFVGKKKFRRDFLRASYSGDCKRHFPTYY